MSQPSVQPIQSQNRIHSLDLLRGFALLGILLMNITSFSHVGPAYLNPLVGVGIEGYNKYFWNFNYLFADTRFMSLFSILFGAGVVLFSQKAEAKAIKPAGLHFRRMFWLLAFGMIHAYLIWMGDILVAYSICGVLVFLFRNFSMRTLWILGSIFFIIPILLSASTYYGLPPDELQSIFAFYHPTEDIMNSQLATMRGSYLEQMPLRIEGAIELQTLVFFIEQFWRVTSMMILGILLFRKGVLSNEKSVDFYKKMALYGITSGLIISSLGLYLAYQNGWDGPYMMNMGNKYNYIASVLMAIGYIGLINWIYKKEIWKGLQSRLQSVGRMAFTNYILMSVICTLIFNGHGLGLIGKVDRSGQFGMVMGVWALMLFISPLILKKYRFGPLEWLWRKLTYFRLRT